MNFLNTHTPNPVAFQAFGINIMWYGILIALGIMLAGVVAYKRAPIHDIIREKTLDILIVSVLFGVIGARLYYVVFNWSQYSGELLQIINLRQGGLAIHGGLIFGFLAAYIICRIYGYRPLNVFDLFVPGVVLAQAIGRWGNYFNMEAHGGPTELPWAILVDGQLVHPTFLYESLWCLAVFIILVFIDNRRTFHGETFLCYGILYSLGRFFIEELRTDSLMLGGFKQAQVLSAVVFVVFLTFYVLQKISARNKDKIFY